MEADRIKWNEKHGQRPEVGDPCPALVRFHGLAPTKHALDIAAGSGRNALFLAQNGFSVDAVDISDVAMNRLAALHPAIRTQCRDLDGFDIPAERYGLIVNTRFLSRRLFPAIREGLVMGGILVFETYRLPGVHAENAGGDHVPAGRKTLRGKTGRGVVCIHPNRLYPSPDSSPSRAQRR